ncbi:uncharacterized protein LOC142334114 isoform X1 [Lycorma delicatula]|uniref:uncharacterized protein LOC142334114 isoform X1 n=1 Tax=Lycorma delicatula TaxID=130591 RepID=UPI003F5148A7
MVQIKLVLIILLSVVYYNEATDQLDIDKNDWEKYYNTEKQNIINLVLRMPLHHTQISCYYCILTEITKQLDLISIISNVNYEKEKIVNKFKSDLVIFKKNIDYWQNVCDKGMPTNIRKTFYEIYTTIHNKALEQQDVTGCMQRFTRTELSITDFDKIKYRYEEDDLSYYIFFKNNDINDLNDKCFSCIQNFVQFELKRWNDIESAVRLTMNSSNMIKDNKHWNTMKDIFLNHERYMDAIQTWITTCSSRTSPNGSKSQMTIDQTNKPLISNGKSKNMENCIYYYIDKVKYQNALVSTGKTVTNDNTVETKVSELVKQIIY